MAVVGRDLKLAMRRQADIVSALFFFVIVVSLFPLGIGPEPDLLRRLAPGLTLSPASGDDLAQRLGLRHYPVLITSTGVEQ